MMPEPPFPPTAHTSSGATTVTSFSDPPVSVPGKGDTVHAAPSQCSTRIRSEWLGVLKYPTAQASSDEAVATAWSTVPFGPWAGAATPDQPVPSQCSTSGRSWDLPDEPTAQASVDEPTAT